MKCYATVELYNANTGELEEEITAAGIVTDVNRYLAMHGYPRIGTMSLGVLYVNPAFCASGLSLFDTDLDAKDYSTCRIDAEMQEHKVAWGDNRVNLDTTGTVPERGLLNKNECSFNFDDFELVWDFNTQQGNTTFRSLCLTRPCSAGKCGGISDPASALERSKTLGYDYSYGGVATFNQNIEKKDSFFIGNGGNAYTDLKTSSDNNYSPFMYKDGDYYVEGFIGSRFRNEKGYYSYNVYYRRFKRSTLYKEFFPTRFCCDLINHDNWGGYDMSYSLDAFQYRREVLDKYEKTVIETQFDNPRDLTAWFGLRSLDVDCVFIGNQAWDGNDYISGIAKIAGYPPTLKDVALAGKNELTTWLYNGISKRRPQDFVVSVDTNRWLFWWVDGNIVKCSSLDGTVLSSLDLNTVFPNGFSWNTEEEHHSIYPKITGDNTPNELRLTVTSADNIRATDKAGCVLVIDKDEMRVTKYLISPNRFIDALSSSYVYDNENPFELTYFPGEGGVMAEIASYYYTKLNFDRDITKSGTQTMKVKVKITNEDSGRDK